MNIFSAKLKDLYYMRNEFLHFHTIENINSRVFYTKYAVFLQKSHFFLIAFNYHNNKQTKPLYYHGFSWDTVVNLY